MGAGLTIFGNEIIFIQKVGKIYYFPVANLSTKKLVTEKIKVRGILVLGSEIKNPISPHKASAATKPSPKLLSMHEMKIKKC